MGKVEKQTGLSRLDRPTGVGKKKQKTKKTKTKKKETLTRGVLLYDSSIIS